MPLLFLLPLAISPLSFPSQTKWKSTLKARRHTNTHQNTASTPIPYFSSKPIVFFCFFWLTFKILITSTSLQTLHSSKRERRELLSSCHHIRALSWDLNSCGKSQSCVSSIRADTRHRDSASAGALMLNILVWLKKAKAWISFYIWPLRCTPCWTELSVYKYAVN